MTDEELDAIRARTNAATPGPWATEPRCEVGEICSTHNDDWLFVGDMGWEWGIPDAMAIPNAEFVAHAREDIPALLAEVTRLRSLVAGHDVAAVCNCGHERRWHYADVSDPGWLNVSPARLFTSAQAACNRQQTAS